MAQNVVGLVFVAGYALDEGESIGEFQAASPESELAPSLIYSVTTPSTGQSPEPTWPCGD